MTGPRGAAGGLGSAEDRQVQLHDCSCVDEDRRGGWVTLRSRPQALGERCLGLVLDAQGYVVDVSTESSDTAFGFVPRELVSCDVE